MKTTVEPLEGNKVKLSVEVDEGEFSTAIDAAFRKIARQVKIPGFRPGKAPRQIIEARVGMDAARQEALSDSLPDFYERALKENDIEPIAAPDIDITSGRESGPIIFDAVVEIMPTVSVAGYQGLKVVLPGFTVTEENIDGKLDMMRDKYGELVTVSRPARDGDYVSMDRKLYRHDETDHGGRGRALPGRVRAPAGPTSTRTCGGPGRATSSSSTSSTPTPRSARSPSRCWSKRSRRRSSPRSPTSGPSRPGTSTRSRS